MTRYDPEGVRLTHGPTGVSARSMDCAPRGRKWAWYHGQALAMLRAKLAHTPEPPRPVRSYHVRPWPGVESFVKQGDQYLARGDETVDGLWRGVVPWLP